jgi:TatA/E family protein of Tat protein translocase
MFGMGMPEIILILAIALIVIGPTKLPGLAKSLGRALGEFRKATTDLKESLEIDNELSEAKKAFDQINENITEPIGSISTDTARKTDGPVGDHPPGAAAGFEFGANDDAAGEPESGASEAPQSDLAKADMDVEDALKTDRAGEEPVPASRDTPTQSHLSDGDEKGVSKHE